jgi:uncharacterized protein DUF3606
MENKTKKRRHIELSQLKVSPVNVRKHGADEDIGELIASIRARITGKQSYEVGYELKKTGRSSAAVKKVGNIHKRVEKWLAQ